MIKIIVNTLPVLLQEVHYVMNNVLEREDIHTPLQHSPSAYNFFSANILKILLVLKHLQSLQGK